MLNAQQMAAVRYIDGPLLVLAGAGSGKTRVITQKIAYLIEQCQYTASHICALTFTNKAAREMQHRLTTLLPAKRRRGIVVSTFHALGLMILKREARHCGLTANFSIFDAEDCLQILRGLSTPGSGQDRAVLEQMQQQISSWKSELLAPEEVPAHPHLLEARLRYQHYQTTLRAYNAVDFDDLIALPVRLFQEVPEVLEYWQQKFRHILVDEYQDSNSSQYLLLAALVGGRAHFTAVGDDDQSIYAWRGAKPENLQQLQRDYPQLNIITLEQNYRSTGQILHLANHLIAHNPKPFPKKLWSEYGLGDPVRVLSCKDEQDEAELVIADLISHKLRQGRAFGDYAILYRGNHQSRLFETVLRSQGIPYRISGGQSWFARTEVKDWFAYLKLLCNEADDAAFLRAVTTPKRGIGDTTLTSLGDYAKSRNQPLFQCADHLALTEHVAEKPRALLQHFKQTIFGFKQRMQTESVMTVLREMVEIFGYEAHVYEHSDNPQQAQKRMDNVWQLLDWVGSLLDKKPGSTLADAVSTMILVDRLDNAEDSEADVIQLMTLHAAKGLEFPCVYLVGLEEGILPHHVSIDTHQIEEERRLAYVGITRARQVLTMSLARRRRRGGETVASLPSRFLEELPQDKLEWFGLAGERDEAKSKALAHSHLATLKTLLAK
ncbi:MAG: ATP-dependent DNA helicase Rep [Legionella sp.]|nr:MAG: ATP-dependent DNA helicase Rep [Legionella sp.]